MHFELEFTQITYEVSMNIEMYLPDRALNELVGVPIQKKVQNPFWQATEMDKAGDHDGAQRIYHELLAPDFNDAVVLGALGMSYAIQGNQGVAFTCLTKALNLFDERFADDLRKHGIKFAEKAPPGKDTFLTQKKAELMNAIGTCYKQENVIDKARYWFEKSQNTLSRISADVQNNLATLYINEGSPEKAMSYLKAALDAEPNHPQSLWNLSLCYLETGDYEKGFALYGNGKRAAVRSERNYSNTGPTPEWDGTPGKTVVVYGEQGIGDEIMFASMLPDALKDCKEVIFECHTRLKELFKNSFPTIDCYGTREDTQIKWVLGPEGVPNYAIDAKISIGDLGKLYRKKLADFPGKRYITPTPESNLRAAKLLNGVFTDDKPVIGINWIGGVKRTRVEVRSLTLEQMLPILSQDAHFVVLQYTDCKDEIFEFEQKHGIKLHYWPELVQAMDYDITAGLVANCDLVISNCSSVIHLAGSMGVPTWVLVPSRPAWRYRLDIDYMPWYGRTVRLFRQAHGTIDWEPVVNAVSLALNSLLYRKEVTENAVHG